MRKFLLSLTAFAIIAGSATVFVSQPVLADDATTVETISPRWPQEDDTHPKSIIIPLFNYRT